MVFFRDFVSAMVGRCIFIYSVLLDRFLLKAQLCTKDFMFHIILVLSKALSTFDPHCGEHGCCADGKTPSPDPAMDGCPENIYNRPKELGKKVTSTKPSKSCGTFKYGCCSDGKTAAKVR